MTTARSSTDHVESRPIEEETLVTYSIHMTPLGQMALVLRNSSLAGVLLGDYVDSLITEMNTRWHGEPLEREQSASHSSLAGQILCGDTPLSLTLDLRGTSFQRKVWAALRQVPRGATMTYHQLAQRVGQPNSSRAVAQACAANPLAIVVPCHRVIRSDGHLSGYRWGIERKRQLLTREGVAVLGERVQSPRANPQSDFAERA